MKNRAKCKLCGSIIESFYRNDYVSCECGEISIDGGQDYFKGSARNWGNFLRIDDKGNEIVVKVIEKGEEDLKQEPKEAHIDSLSEEDHLQALDEIIDSFEKLPPQAMDLPITHRDHLSILILFRAILKAKDRRP